MKLRFTAKEVLIHHAIRLIAENYQTLYECAKMHSVDYQNLCKWIRDPEKFSLKFALYLIDYHMSQVVCFRTV